MHSQAKWGRWEPSSWHLDSFGFVWIHRRAGTFRVLWESTSIEPFRTQWHSWTFQIVFQGPSSQPGIEAGGHCQALYCTTREMGRLVSSWGRPARLDPVANWRNGGKPSRDVPSRLLTRTSVTEPFRHQGSGVAEWFPPTHRRRSPEIPGWPRAGQHSRWGFFRKPSSGSNPELASLARSVRTGPGETWTG
jgi:hypothetical protein